MGEGKGVMSSAAEVGAVEVDAGLEAEATPATAALRSSSGDIGFVVVVATREEVVMMMMLKHEKAKYAAEISAGKGRLLTPTRVPPGH